jgi:flagellar hook-basal body complex protein FliE
MELPPIAAKYDHKLRFGFYVVGRLRARTLDAQAERVRKATDALTQACHALDGAACAVQEAVARRDHWVEAYEDKVAELVKTIDDTPALAAVKRSILQNKPNYYSEVPLGELEKRGLELCGRVDKFIPPKFKDLRDRTGKELRARVDGFKQATAKMSEARAALFEARKLREKVTKEWDETLRGMHAELIKLVGEETAERIYPALRKVETLEGDDKVGKLGEAKGGITLQQLAQMQR